jgi:hypothetical protein
MVAHLQVHPQANVMPQMVGRDVRRRQPDLTGIVERQEAERAVKRVTLLCLQQKAARPAESIIGEAAQRIVAVDIGTAKRLIKYHYPGADRFEGETYRLRCPSCSAVQ